MKFFIVTSLLSFIVFLSFGQLAANRLVQGTLTDAQTNQVIPYAHIKLYNGTQGGLSNESGDFRVLFKGVKPNDQLVISCIGYQSLTYSFADLPERILMQPELKYLRKVEVNGAQQSYEEQLFQIVDQQIESILGLNYRLSCYYFSYWKSAAMQDSLVNEAVFNLYRKNSYTHKHFQTSSIFHKQQLSDTSTLIPWPVHALGMADFRKHIGLLTRNRNKEVVVDSLLSDGKLSKFYYHISAPKKSILIYDDLRYFSGMLIYDEEERRIVAHEKHYVFLDDEDDGFTDATLQISYDKVGVRNLPSLVKLSFVGQLEGVLHTGTDITRINAVTFDDFEIPAKDELVYKIKEAPFDPAFWKDYNRVSK